MNPFVVSLNEEDTQIDSWMNRRAIPIAVLSEKVAEILRAVKEKGDASLYEYTQNFDGVKLDHLRVEREVLESAWQAIGDALKVALKTADTNVRAFAKGSMRQDWSMVNTQGVKLTEIFRPFQRVGLYVPGGSAPLVSTVIMTASIASAAGVKEVVVCTPPDKQTGKINQGLLAALYLAGVTEVYQVGGAQAIAAMAYGTESIMPVNKIFGPGNAYVVEAKRQVVGAVSIDLLPGPSEVMIYADESADPRYIAADLLAQAEHGKDSQAIFISTDAGMIKSVGEEIEKQSQGLSRQAQLKEVLEHGLKMVLAKDEEQALKWVNEYAPEHLSLVVKDEDAALAKIHHAGAIFVGRYSPVAVGDFMAGPSHTLPTGGACKSFQGLTVDMFQRRTSIIRMDHEACQQSETTVREFAKVEGLDAHGESVSIRCRTQ
jgi:histidinol dehydrogenase